jgi:polyketide cyclase/dehydrase/lipid transport protein
MRIVLWALLALASLIVLISVIGWLLPRDHVATRIGRYRQPPETIWKVITDVDAMPGWREGLKSVEHLPDSNGLPAHLEITADGKIPFETIEMTPPQKLVTRIADPKLPFGGTWTFEIVPVADGATLRITENGYVTNPFFRFMSRFVFSQTSTMETYLKSLAKKFGEEPRVEE